MIPKEELQKIKKELINCKNPLFIFHDDCDGLASFLLLHKFAKKGNWAVLKKKTPEIDRSFLSAVKRHSPDKIFILDIALVNQDFVDEAGIPIIWIDHHLPLERQNTKYFNPRIENKGDSRPTSYWCYIAVDGEKWIAMLGCLGDYFVPEFVEDFMKEYPGLMHKTTDADEIIFNTQFGKLLSIVSFNLTGTKKEANRFIELILKIKNPNEILKKETDEGRLIYERYEKVKKEYDKIISNALRQEYDDILLYRYKEEKYSFLGILSNELRYRSKAKVVIVAKEKGNEIRCSIRTKKINVLPILKKSLEGIEGRGGGHEVAAGAIVAKDDFSKFIKRFTELIKKQKAADSEK